MPKGPAARILDPVLHPLPGILQPGPGSLTVLIGGLPAWRGVPAAAAAGIAVELSVLKANPAQRLYARLGFRPVGEAARAYTLRWTPPRAAKA